MTQTLIAIDPVALDRLAKEIEKLHKRLDAFDMQPRSEWVSIKEYAAQHSVTTNTVRNRIARGELDVKGRGQSRMVRVSPVA